MEPSFQVLPPLPPAPQPPPPPKLQPQGIVAWVAAGAFAVFKYGWLFLKSFKTVLSMAFMIWLYSGKFGWPFAAGFVFLIFVHEMGHVIAAKCLGIPVSAPLFIPFLGAAIAMKQNPRDAWTEALMAYGGPLAGCIGSWICWWLALQLEAPWVMAVASTSFVINLFNMIPVPPLDGGRICSAVSAWFWLIGLVLLSGAVLYFHSFNSSLIIILILIVAFSRIRETLFGQETDEMRRYYQMPITYRFAMALMYLALIAALLIGYWDASSYLSYLWDNSSSD